MTTTVNATSVARCEDKVYKPVAELFYFIPLIYGIPTLFLYFNIVAIIVIRRRNPVLKLAFFKIYAAYSVMVSVNDRVTTMLATIDNFGNNSDGSDVVLRHDINTLHRNRLFMSRHARAVWNPVIWAFTCAICHDVLSTRTILRCYRTFYQQNDGGIISNKL